MVKFNGKGGGSKSMPKMHLHLKKGALTNYAHRHHESVSAAIKQGLHSHNKLLKKRAVFASNTFLN